MSFDLKFVKLTADVLDFFFFNTRKRDTDSSPVVSLA